VIGERIAGRAILVKLYGELKTVQQAVYPLLAAHRVFFKY
jgi:hypothetical protein